MIYIESKDKIKELTCSQLSAFFYINDKDRKFIECVFDETLERVNNCFINNKNKYFEDKEKQDVRFNPYHSVQYMIYLYYLSNTIFNKKIGNYLCDKIYYLNKILNGVDLLYAIELPKRWCAEHPVGSVMGRAHYGENFFFYQNCTVGGDKGIYPILGENIIMYEDSAILGNSHIGNNVKLGAGTLVKNQDVPDNSIVFGSSPNLIIKNNKK